MRMAELISLVRLGRDVKPTSLKQLGYTVSLLRQFLGREPVLDDFTDDLLNRWIDWLASTPSRHGPLRRKRTIKTQRNNAITLWNFAWEAELVERTPRRVKKIKVGPTLPEAWSEQQMAIWLAACDRIPGFVASVLAPAKVVMRAWSLLCWDTCARMCDLLRLKRSDISSDGSVVIVQEKTAHPVLCRLRPETIAAIDEVCRHSGKDHIFCFGRATILHHWAKVREASGLNGTPKKIRKSRATSAEALRRGSAPIVLGHKPGSTVAYRAYVDPRQTLPDPGLPPAIDRMAE